MPARWTRPFPGGPFPVPTLLVLMGLPGCTVPEFEGPQIQSPPPAYTMRPAIKQERRMFPDREVVYHHAWVEASWGNFSGIYINGHPGVMTREDVEAARQAAMSTPKVQDVEYGGIGRFTSGDGRPSWGWVEHWRNPTHGGLEYVAFRAVIPYDTVSYAIEFITGDPGLKLRPDSMQAIVASFAVGKTTLNIPLLLAFTALGLLVLNFFRKRFGKTGWEQFRDMELVTIPTEGGSGSPGSSSPGSGSGGGGGGGASGGAATGSADDRPSPPRPKFGPVFKPEE